MGPAIEKDPNGIGYTQLAGIPAGVKILKLNGTAPSKSTVLDASSKDGQRFVEEEGFIAVI